MGRQPLISALLVLGLGCADGFRRTPSFDGPTGSTVLDSREMGPFEEPVGFVANSRSGLIVPIDLKHATLLSDQFAAPFIRPRWVATGAARILGQLAVWSPTDEQVTLYAADIANDVMVEAPYIVGMNPAPVVVQATHTGAEFSDADGSGDDAKLTGIELINGWTTTETWTITYDGSEWVVDGTASGRQPDPAQTGKYFRSENHELAFTIKGNATRGDRFTLQTNTGLIEHDLGGTILALQRIPEQPLLIAAVWDPLNEESHVVLWDLDLGSERGRFTLPEGAQAWRFAFGHTVADLFIADAHQARVFEALLDIEQPSNSVWDEIPTIAPVSAIAWVFDELSPIENVLDEEDTGSIFTDPAVDRDYEHLFVAPAGLARVDIYDLKNGEWIDTNPLDDAEGGFSLNSPVIGLAAAPERVFLRERNDAGVRLQEKVVAVSTYQGSMVILEADSGCAAQTNEGPHVPISRGVETVQFVDVGNPSSPEMVADDDTSRRVQTSQCGGIVRSEQWTVMFDEVIGQWEVEGSISGLQDNVAIEDQRYVSDNGGISFTIASGVQPSSDGDNFVFYTDEGILRIDQVMRPGASAADPLELPAEPTIFQYLAGPTGGGWDLKDLRTFIMLPVTNSDVVLRVRLKQWKVEVIWE
jgi:hypothetical protein